VKREFRLTRSTDFKQVRQYGKSYAHPLLVLIAYPNPDGKLRIGISAGRSVGKAVERNRAKRRLRAALAGLISDMQPGWDLIFLARTSIRDAEFPQIKDGILLVLKRAGLLAQVSTKIDDRS
jgi:ribonuclease P protein component